MPFINRKVNSNLPPEGYYKGKFVGIEQRTMPSAFHNTDVEVNIYIFEGKRLEDVGNDDAPIYECRCIVNNTWGPRSRQYELLTRMAGVSTVHPTGIVVSEQRDIPDDILDELDKSDFLQWYGAEYMWQVVHKTKTDKDGAKMVRAYILPSSVARPAGEPSLIDVHRQLQQNPKALEDDPFDTQS